MGRAFEYRKARKMKRWGHMARQYQLTTAATSPSLVTSTYLSHKSLQNLVKNLQTLHNGQSRSTLKKA